MPTYLDSSSAIFDMQCRCAGKRYSSVWALHCSCEVKTSYVPERVATLDGSTCGAISARKGWSGAPHIIAEICPDAKLMKGRVEAWGGTHLLECELIKLLATYSAFAEVRDKLVLAKRMDCITAIRVS